MIWNEQPTKRGIEQRIALSKSVVLNVIVWILEINDDDDRRKLKNEFKFKLQLKEKNTIKNVDFE